MAKHYNKPYVWADFSGSSPVLHVRMWSLDDLGISNDVVRSMELEDMFIIIFQLTSVEEEMDVRGCKVVIDVGSFSRPVYDPASHNKIMVMIENHEGDIMGLQTIIPSLSEFTSAGTSPPTMKPYLWMQFIATTNSVVHVAAELTQDSTLSEEEPINEPDKYRRIVNYTVHAGSSSDEGVVHDDHNLDDGEYDPVMDNIIIRLIEYNSDGTERRKGSGTTHTSEGDASGDD
jgi:hypothetical protein